MHPLLAATRKASLIAHVLMMERWTVAMTTVKPMVTRMVSKDKKKKMMMEREKKKRENIGK